MDRYYEQESREVSGGDVNFPARVGSEDLRNIIESMRGRIGLLKEHGEYLIGPLWVRVVGNDPEYSIFHDDCGIYEVALPTRPESVSIWSIMEKDFPDLMRKD